jgi:hypothetical protein
LNTTCPTCRGAITEGQPCPICAALERLRAKVAECGALRGWIEENPKTEVKPPPQDHWWNAL